MKELFENVSKGGIGCTTQKSPTNSPNLEYSKQMTTRRRRNRRTQWVKQFTMFAGWHVSSGQQVHRCMSHDDDDCFCYFQQ